MVLAKSLVFGWGRSLLSVFEKSASVSHGETGEKRGELVWGVGIGEIKFFYCFRSKKVVKRLIISNSENTDYFDLV